VDPRDAFALGHATHPEASGHPSIIRFTDVRLHLDGRDPARISPCKATAGSVKLVLLRDLLPSQSGQQPPAVIDLLNLH
jgi:hypothetical protein